MVGTAQTDTLSAADNDYLEDRADVLKLPADSIASPTLYDSSVVKLRVPNSRSVAELKADKDYQYIERKTSSNNFFERLLLWLLTKVGSLFRVVSDGGLGQYAFVLAMALLVGWLLYKADFVSGLFQRNSKSIPLPHEVMAENIHELSFDTIIADALDTRNYRLAIRLYYLKTLKHLADKDLIDWQLTKTNRAYVEEITDKSFRKDFERLTSQFEYVWYGEFDLSDANFLELKTDFQNFMNRIV